MTATYLPDAHDDAAPTIFAGREAIYARLQQVLIDSGGRPAHVISGQAHTGKTALLQQLGAHVEPNILSLYIALSAAPLTDERAWLVYLVQVTDALLAHEQFSRRRLPDPLPDDATAAQWRDWLRDDYLPGVLLTIRPQRRLVWLLDDAEYLADALEAGHLPDDHTAYLRDLLTTHAPLSIVLTVDAEHESRLHRLEPLVDPAAAERIGPLTDAASRDLIRAMAPGLDDDGVATIQAQTGGMPDLLQAYAPALSGAWEGATTAQIRAMNETVYAAMTDAFRDRWRQLPQDERLVLTALSECIYDDPTRLPTVERLQTWLVETDYPLDTITINTALRSLAYRHWLRADADGVRVTAGLLQRWLLEYGRLNPVAASGRSERVTLPRGWLLLVILLAALLVVALLTVPQRVSAPETQNIPPTVTLNAGDQP